MSKASIADHSLEWGKLTRSVRANVADVPYLEDLLSELETLVDRSHEIRIERAALDARSQQLTRDLQAVTSRARTVAAQLRSGLKTRFGHGSEKLVEFGLRPRRKRLDIEMEEARVSAAPPSRDETPDP